MRNTTEYKRFEKLVDQTLSVSHKEIKAKLEEEKRIKKRKKSRKSSASHEANDRA